VRRCERLQPTMRPMTKDDAKRAHDEALRELERRLRAVLEPLRPQRGGDTR
jgi:hypothetical protein